eukprot:11360385-Prorocentrum_lima.AAC.1
MNYCHSVPANHFAFAGRAGTLTRSPAAVCPFPAVSLSRTSPSGQSAVCLYCRRSEHANAGGQSHGSPE